MVVTLVTLTVIVVVGIPLQHVINQRARGQREAGHETPWNRRLLGFAPEGQPVSVTRRCVGAFLVLISIVCFAFSNDATSSSKIALWIVAFSCVAGLVSLRVWWARH
jgi:hypothetical protein